MIITTINAKGGVGKTTSTIFLATVFAQRGIPVTVTDLDRQGSALDWAERAEDGGDPLPFNVELSIPKRVDRQAALVADNEMMFIDVPPGDENAIEAAIAVSDFIIMPTHSAAADLSRVWELRDAVGGTPHAVLLTFARKGTSALEAAREARLKPRTCRTLKRRSRCARICTLPLATAPAPTCIVTTRCPTRLWR
ncbi:ParA family protein [Corynebacterium striatum]